MSGKYLQISHSPSNGERIVEHGLEDIFKIDSAELVLGT